MNTSPCPYGLFGKCLLPLFLCAALSSSGQPRNYRFRFVNLPENFSNQFITLLDEDAAGMLWFVTNNGLHRYDGNGVLTFDMQSKPSLPDINISCLFADSHSNLWIAARKNLVRFDLKSWTTNVIPFPERHFPTSRDRMITSINEAKDGTVYFGSGNGKLFSYTGNSLHFIAQVRFPNNGSHDACPAIRTIRETVKGQLWLTTERGQVVHLFPAQQKPPVYYELNAFQRTGINFLAFGDSGKCLLYADEAGAFLLDTTSGALTSLAPPPGLASLRNSTNYPVALEEDKVAFFFSGSAPGLEGFAVYDFRDGSFKNLNAVYPASFRTSIFRKLAYKNRTVYISTDRGIAAVSYINNPFAVSNADLENINSIRTIYKQGNGNIYIGSYKEKFTQLNESTNETKPLSDQMVSCLLPWGRDSLLAGTEGRLPLWYFPSANRFEPVFKKNTSADVYGINNYVLCLVKENDTLVWAGTYAGCYLFNPLTGAVTKPAWAGAGSAMQQLNVTDILRAGNNRFFATYEGIFKYNVLTGSCTRLFATADSSDATARYNCLQLVGSQIWAGSNGNGILVFDTAGRIKKILTTAEGLASNIVFSLPVCKNLVLAGTSKGLSIIDESSGSMHSYSSQRYLPSNEFNRSAWFVKGDTVYMGTTNGIIRFTLPVVEQPASRPSLPVRLSSFSLNNGDETRFDYSVAYATPSFLNIPAGTRSFSLSFGGLDDAAAELNLSYRFGSDSTWQNIGQRREITFVNLSPGKYTIQIASRLPDGQRTGNLLTIPVEVQPRFYQTAWFRILLVLAALAMIWLGIKYRERTLRKEQRLRSRIAGDLHDEVGSALTRIYFQADRLSSATGHTEDSRQQAPLQKIVTSSQEALSSMSDMVWSIDAHYDNASDMVGRMKDYLARLQDELDCRCRFEVTGDHEKRYMAQLSRQNVFLIFKEAVTNALKYGLHKQVSIRLCFEKNLLVLTVQNEKAVLPTAAHPAQGGHGLKNMQLRADKIKASLAISGDNGLFTVLLRLKE